MVKYDGENKNLRVEEKKKKKKKSANMVPGECYLEVEEEQVAFVLPSVGEKLVVLVAGECLLLRPRSCGQREQTGHI